jgi:DNA-binding MarR family transcriptional regulator
MPRDLAALVVQLSRRLIAMEEPILARHETSMWAYIVLSALRDRPTRTQAALATAINADKTRVIPVLDDLQRRGLITRAPDPADRRVHVLGLTPAGDRLQKAVQADIRTAEDELLAVVPAEHRDAFRAALEALSPAS